MAPMQSKIKLHNHAEAHEINLRAFPIEIETNKEGKKLLVKQIRVRTLGHADQDSESICFLNSYGFIKEAPKEEEFIREDRPPESKITLTACMLPLGPGPNIRSPNQLLKSAADMKISVRKTAGSREQVIFHVTRAPPILQNFQFIRERYACVSSDKFIKSPGKIRAGPDYCYIITFLSLTYCPISQKFKVPRPLLSFRSTRMRSVHLEVIFKIQCSSDSPLKKGLITDDEKGVPKASVWIHLCNFYKGRNITKTYDEAYFAEKCKKMALSVGISDLWGPTIVVHAEGKIPKAASLFFNSRGWALHPLSDAAPTLAKSLWSIGCEILEVNAILQGSDYSSLLLSSDVLYRKIKIDPHIQTRSSTGWNPFKKTISMPNLMDGQ
uniref:Matrix protein n=1 Tax=Eptesicus fuscus orthorubulavirus TaxID=2884705 RepID=A0A8K1N9D6_9MONO|nr:M [Eptesicus fuscus orthorubulavirus] [Eptesicus fuscus orthorubulavirus]